MSTIVLTAANQGSTTYANLGDTIILALGGNFGSGAGPTFQPGTVSSDGGIVASPPGPPMPFGDFSFQVTGPGGIYAYYGAHTLVGKWTIAVGASVPSGNPGGTIYHPPGYKPHHALEGIPDMATQQTGMTKWQEYTGPAPEGLGDLPFYDPARRADTIGETDTHWVKKERRPDGGIVVRIAEKLTRGLGGNSQLGMKQGDAMIVDAAYAENAASGWQSGAIPSSQQYNANDVFDLVTPGGNFGGITDTVYVQFKDPPNAQLWKYEPANNEGYNIATGVDQTKLVPQAQIGSNGQPTVTPSGGGPGLITKFQTASTTTKIVIVGGGVLVLGALGLWFYGRLGKKHHAGGAHHAHHHRARASAPRRRRRGRGRR